MTARLTSPAPSPNAPPTVEAPSLDQAIARARADHPLARVVRLRVGADLFWMKQPERHATLRKRSAKGDGTAALLREHQTLQSLAQQGLAVPDVVSFGQDHLVIADCGLTLTDLFSAPGYRVEDGLHAYRMAGHALADLHRQGLALGRGKSKDFCWDGTRIRFIDFEVPPVPFDPATGGRRNVVNFVFHTYFESFLTGIDAHAETRSFLHGYAEAGGPLSGLTLAAAQRWARRRWWLAALSLPLAYMRPAGRAPDVKAIAPTLGMLAFPETALSRLAGAVGTA